MLEQEAAVRPRDLVMSRLKAMGEVSDPGGRASAVLAEATGYTGSSAAFAQLLSGMERAGLIKREIRGKRTYRITMAPGAVAARDPGSADSGSGGGAAARGAASGIDYEELARRLLAEVARRDHAELARTVTSLERKLASMEARQRRLRTENARLRELLVETRESLDEQPPLATGDPDAYALDTGTVRLLERLLASLRGEDSSGQSA